MAVRSRLFNAVYGRALHDTFENEEWIAKPGIYMWEIAGSGRYVGKFTRERRLQVYALNTHRLITGQPYHIKGRGFRIVHRALAKAFVEERRIVLRILTNTPLAELNSTEREVIREYGCLNDKGLSGAQHACTCGREEPGNPCKPIPPALLWPAGETATRTLVQPPSLTSHDRPSE